MIELGDSPVCVKHVTQGSTMVSAMQLAACYRRKRVRSVWTCRASTLGTLPAKIYRVLIARFPFCQTAFCFDSADVLFDSVVINCREIEVKSIVGTNFQMAVKSLRFSLLFREFYIFLTECTRVPYHRFYFTVATFLLFQCRRKLPVTKRKVVTFSSSNFRVTVTFRAFSFATPD